MQATMLAPAAVLVAWSLVVMFWMVVTRFTAIKKAGLNLGAKPGGRGQDLDGVLPANVQWKSHNYTHLMEQPTIFYAAVVIIAIMGPSAADVRAAWLYVMLRIIHSLWQAMINKVPVRIALFTASTIALVFLAYRAVSLTLFNTTQVLS